MFEWRPIKDFPGYEINQSGTVRRVTYHKPTVSERGCLMVRLYKKKKLMRRSISKLVRETFGEQND